MILVKILGTKRPQRYAVRRSIEAAQTELLKERPDLEVSISELKTLEEVQQYTAVFAYPSLVVNEKLVCVGRFPKKTEVAGWLRESL